MATSIDSLYAKALFERKAQLTASAQRLDKKEGSSKQSLGESCRRALLIVACPLLKVESLSHDEVKVQVDLLFQQAKVIHKTKRGALILLGDIVCYAGKFGVVTYSIPTIGWPLDVFNWSRHSIIDNRELLRQIGATADGYDGRDTVFNYGNCIKQEEVVQQVA